MRTEIKPWYRRASTQSAFLVVFLALAAALAEVLMAWAAPAAEASLQRHVLFFLAALILLLVPALPLAFWLRSLRLRREEREASSEAQIRWEIEKFQREQEAGAGRDDDRA